MKFSSMKQDNWIQELYVKEFHKPKLLSTDFYYDKNQMVFTEQYHIRRGVCCGSGCRHCPFEPQHKKGNIELQDIYIKEK